MPWDVICTFTLKVTPRWLSVVVGSELARNPTPKTHRRRGASVSAPGKMCHWAREMHMQMHMQDMPRPGHVQKGQDAHIVPRHKCQGWRWRYTIGIRCHR